MTNHIVSPVGRFVQGDLFELNTKNMQGGERRNKKGELSPQAVCVVAYEKSNPEWPAFEAHIRQVAASGFPQFFPQGPSGQCVNPLFSFKIQDGDGFDGNGKPNATKPGHAGCWIVKFTSGYLPRVFPRGQFEPHQQIVNRAEVRLGHYVRVGCSVSPNNDSQRPSVFVNHTFVEHMGFGPEIIIGPSAQDIMGKAPAATYMPAGMSASPLSTPATTAPAPTGAAPTPYGGYMQTPPAPPAAPAAPAAPQRMMTAKANGATYESFVAAGWTDAALVSHGYMDQLPV